MLWFLSYLCRRYFTIAGQPSHTITTKTVDDKTKAREDSAKKGLEVLAAIQMKQEEDKIITQEAQTLKQKFLERNLPEKKMKELLIRKANYNNTSNQPNGTQSSSAKRDQMQKFV